MEEINMERVTLEDCLEAFEKRGLIVDIRMGKIIAFLEEWL